MKVSYTNGLNEVISRTEHDGANKDTIFFLYDANCNVNAIVDEDGELVKTFDYEEFGGPHPDGIGQTYLTNGNAENNKLQFAGGVGHLTDDSGLIYMRARYYDPATGRFISEDPGRDGLNWYTYCNNNSVNLIDPSGKNAAVPDVFADIGAILRFIGARLMWSGMNMYEAGYLKEEEGRFLQYAADAMPGMFGPATASAGVFIQIEGGLEAKAGVEAFVTGLAFWMAGNLLTALGPEAYEYYDDIGTMLGQ